MRTLNGVILHCAAVLLVAVAGCAGAVSGPQATKTVHQSERGAVERSVATTPSVKQPAAESARKVEQESNIDGNIQAPPASPTGETPVEPIPRRVTALKPPTIRPAVMPDVVLSDAHAADCYVRVGDPFPEFRLPDLAGRARELSELQGDGLTVVVLWAGDRLAAESQLRYLNEQIAGYADVGVRAVAINIGQQPVQVRTAVDALEISVPVLLDLDGRLFARVGKDHLPRTFLLDRNRRILWFDIEFSRHTREKLEQAIHASLNST